jgi:hypothetical protein
VIERVLSEKVHVHREVVMKKWLSRIGGAVLMGLAWAAVWAPIGVLIGMIVDPDGSMDEPWILVGAYPGFLSAVIFSMVIWGAERRRRFDELSLTRVGAFGAVAGLLVGMVPFVAGSNSTSLPTWLLMFAIIGPITLVSAVSAGGSLALARRAEKLNLLDGRADVVKGVTGG